MYVFGYKCIWVLTRCSISCSDCGVCEGGNEKEWSAGAGCDWLTLVVPYERCGVEQEGRAGYWAGPQTPKGTEVTEVFSLNVLNTFCHLTAVTVTLTCMSLDVGSRKANQFIHSVGVDIRSIIVFFARTDCSQSSFKAQSTSFSSFHCYESVLLFHNCIYEPSLISHPDVLLFFV